MPLGREQKRNLSLFLKALCAPWFSKRGKHLTPHPWLLGTHVESRILELMFHEFVGIKSRLSVATDCQKDLIFP